MFTLKRENARLLEEINRKKQIEQRAQWEPHFYFRTKEVYVKPNTASRYVKEKIYIPIGRIDWNYIKGRGLEEAVKIALEKLGIRKNRGYRIVKHHVWQNGIDVYAYRISDGEPILGIECKNFSPQGYLTMKEARRTVKNLEPFKNKLLLFSHRRNILNLNPEILKMLKEADIEIEYIGKEIIPNEIYDCLQLRRSGEEYELYKRVYPLREVRRIFPSHFDFIPLDKRAIKLVAKKLFRILYRMGAVSLIVYFMYTEKRDGVSKANYRARIIIILASATYFHKFGDAQYALIRKNQCFEADFIDPTYAIQLVFTLPIQHCIHRYCKYRWECESFTAPASACPRLKGRKECDSFFENKIRKARAYTILRERRFKGGNCVYCGKPVMKEDDWIYVRINKRKRIAHRKCLPDPTLSEWIMPSPPVFSA